jgi:hypothetical protein
MCMSDERRSQHDELRAIEEEIGNSILREHRLAFLALDENDKNNNDDPDLNDALVDAESDALEKVISMPCESAAVLIENTCRYLAPYVTMIDPDCEEAHAITDAVLAFLSEREIAA